MQIHDLLALMARQNASDLHLKPMRPPLLRVDGSLRPLDAPPLQPTEIAGMVQEVLDERQKRLLADNLQVDIGISVPGVSRFRGTVYYQRSTIAAVFRRIPFQFPTIDEWGLPEVLFDMTKLPEGLILVTGPTGSGKSSTLAAMLRHITTVRPCHIVTIEDPIEFLVSDRIASVSQREVGTDCLGFPQALKNALRQDPDVIMVGEMRDLETISTVLTAAETGHLVFSTLHTNGAAQTIDRIIDAFPDRQQAQVRVQLSQVLQAIVSLRLLERSDGSGRTAAVEILRNTPRIQRLIQEANQADLLQEMENSVTFDRMQSMNQSLVALALTGQITKETAIANSPNPSDFDLLLRRHLGMRVEKRRPADLDSAFAEFEEGGSVQEGDSMFPFCDYSKITRLMEIEKAMSDEKERMLADLAERDERIRVLTEQMREREVEEEAIRAESARIQEEKEKWERAASFLKQEAEAKIAKLNARIRELTGGAPPATPPNPANAAPKTGTFFRK